MPTPDTETLAARLRAVERALTDEETTLDPVPSSHPERHDGPGPALLAAALAGGLATAAVTLCPPVPDWAAPVAAVCAAGVGLAVHYQPAVTFGSGPRRWSGCSRTR